MLLIPIGLILVFFYINADIGGLVVDLLPDVVGYVLSAINACKFRERSYPFSNLMILSISLAVYSVAVRLVLPTGMLGVAASLLELVLQLYLLKFIVDGVEDIGRIEGAHLNGDVLNRWRLWLSVAWGAVFVCATASALAPWLVLVGKPVVAVWAVLCILFLITLFRTDHRYKLLVKLGVPEPHLDDDEEVESEDDG